MKNKKRKIVLSVLSALLIIALGGGVTGDMAGFAAAIYARGIRFVQESGLYEHKPDARMFGFNHPNPGVLDNDLHGYEEWFTVPEDFPLPEDFTRQQFPGGLYAVLTIRFPEFHHWWTLNQWVEKSEEFDIDWRGDESTMGGCLEEHLNWVRSAHLGSTTDGSDGQIDLMFPIKRRNP